VHELQPDVIVHLAARAGVRPSIEQPAPARSSPGRVSFTPRARASTATGPTRPFARRIR
jgi:hypothetical protein